MQERVQNILQKIVEWWKKFNNKQRALILSAIGVVVIALVILAVVMANPKMVVLYVCDDYKEAAEINRLLQSDGSIKYDTTSDGKTFLVAESDEAAASMLLGENNFPSKTYSIDNVVNGSFTATEADKNKKYEAYLEAKFADHIAQLAYVNWCNIDITMPDNDGTILGPQKSATAAVTLGLKYSINEDLAAGLAKYITTQLGNKTSEGITIIDSNGNVLYSGADASSIAGVVSSQLSFLQKMEKLAKDEIYAVLVETGVFANVKVAMNLEVNFDKVVIKKKELGIPNGLTGGAITSQSLYDFESTMGYEGGVPGTDTNDDTTYVFQDGEKGYTVISESDTLYDWDQVDTVIESNGGKIEYDNCSAMIVATKHIIYNEKDLRISGQLDDISFEEFKVLNKDTRVVVVDDYLVDGLVDALHFDAEQITFLCHEIPVFVDEQTGGRSIADYAQIIIAVLIFALLGFVVFRSTRSQKEEEPESEISVETLLEATSGTEQLEDIGYNEKSDVRIMIEKFVDENPDAVAQLLRNWLNEDWE